MNQSTRAADLAIRSAATAAVVAVAAIAAVISYRHAYTLAIRHGESGTTAALVPVTADGLLLVAGLVMLDAARRGERAPVLARLALALGIVATIAANLAHGVAHGVVGALVAAWPAVTLILTVELLMGMIRRGARPDDAGPEVLKEEPWTGGPVGMEWWDVLPPAAADAGSLSRPVASARESVPGVVATTATGSDGLVEIIATARERYAEMIATGALPSIRAIRRDLHVGHPRAVRVRSALESEIARGGVLATA